MRQLKNPKIWWRALIFAIRKLENPLWCPKSYRPISLLCILFKILERLICAHVDPIIETLLPRKQAGFRHRRSAVDQVTWLTQNIEDSLKKKKAGVVFVDFTAAYGTVWYRGLNCKLLPDRHMVHMIMQMVGNRSFTLPPETVKGAGYDIWRTASNRDLSWCPFSSTPTSTTCKPTTVSRMYAYSDDLAIMHADGDWQAVEGVLNKDMANAGEYLQTWKLKLSITKKRCLQPSTLTTRKLNVSLKST